VGACLVVRGSAATALEEAIHPSVHTSISKMYLLCGCCSAWAAQAALHTSTAVAGKVKHKQA
jgi:hypothetical protein